MKNIITSILITLCLSSFGQSDTSDIEVETFNSELMNTLIIELINEHRVNHRLEPLIYEDSIGKFAMNHAKLLCDSNAFHHSDIMDGYLKGECITGVEGKQLRTYKDLAETAVGRWIGSPGHNKILLDREATIYGIGTYANVQFQDLTHVPQEIIDSYGGPEGAAWLIGNYDVVNFVFDVD